MSKQLQKAIELAKKTGDKIIIFDGKNDENACVIIPFGEYEKLLDVGRIEEDLTQREMIDSINQDVAEWKNSHSFGFSESDEFKKTIPINEERVHIEDITHEEVLVEELENDEDEYEKKFLDDEMGDKKSSWNIPSSRKTAAEEIIEEDRHYLEEIPY